MAAVVRVTAAKGYEAMSVADILSEAGVGRQSFYELFADKRDCLLAAHTMLVDDLEATVAPFFQGTDPWPRRVRAAVEVGLDWFASNPEAARVTVIELAAVGPVARERFLATFHRFSALFDEGLEEPEAAVDLPNILSLTFASAFARIYEEIAMDRTAELPKLLSELTFELLVPFVGEAAARAAATGEET
jgi:AcrR family transcriptional regulator